MQVWTTAKPKKKVESRVRRLEGGGAKGRKQAGKVGEREIKKNGASGQSGAMWKKNQKQVGLH